jgi:hypothetical protein
MKWTLPFLLFLLLIVGCKKDDFIPRWFLIINDSGYDVTLKSTKGEPDIVLEKGERKDVATRYGLKYDIVPNTPTTQALEFRGGVDVVTIVSYDYKLEYIIEGTAEKADIELIDDKGVTRTFRSVSLPTKYQYKTFCLCRAYVSAKRVGDTGAVTVKLFKRGRYFKEATSNDYHSATVILDNWQ